MRILLLAIFLLTLFNCASNKKKPLSFTDHDSFNQIKSCTGRGSISSVGSFSGRLSFNFISQNDSLFCQLQDFLGRKVLLLWLTPLSIDAWNLIDNKKYNYSNINGILPILSVLNPEHLIKFMCGRGITLNDINAPSKAGIEIRFRKKNQDNIKVDEVVFVDKSKRQQLSIKIASRVYNNDYLNLKKYWDMILS